MVVNETTVDVRYKETDMMGIVHHSNYLIWMEVGRTHLIKQLGYNYAGLEEKGYLSPVIDVSVQYKTSMTYGQTATIRTWIESHDRLRTKYGYEILHEDRTLAVTGVTEHVLVKKESFRPVSLERVDPEWDAAYKKACRVKD